MRKRVFDVVAGTLLALLVLPTVVILAIACAIALRSSPFFVQTRIGRNGRPFRFLKLRTLPPSTPAYASKYELDERAVPRFTWRLRQLHLDELPQLFLVPLGKMSLVGPRPEMPELYARMGEAFAAERTVVRPGCTGLWQISDQSHRLIREAPEFDRFYVERHTVRLDVWIVARTIRSLLPGRAAGVSLQQVPRWTGVLAPVAPATVAAPEPVRIDLDLLSTARLDVASDAVAAISVDA